ncbi:hypothetical protein HC928_03575 [bacterium]|nr:hypothetical protein [bacterium]
MQTCHFMMTFERAKLTVLIHCGQALRLARHGVTAMPSSPKLHEQPCVCRFEAIARRGLR